MELSIDWFIKHGPVACGVVSFLLLMACNLYNSKSSNLTDLFIVGASGASLPTGCLLIYGAFDNSIIDKLSDAGVYIAFAGLALIFIFYRTFKDKM